MFEDPQNSHRSPEDVHVSSGPSGTLRGGGRRGHDGASLSASASDCGCPHRRWDLIAHFVWESSIKMADLIAGAYNCVTNVCSRSAPLRVFPASSIYTPKLVAATDTQVTVIDALRDNVLGGSRAK